MERCMPYFLPFVLMKAISTIQEEKLLSYQLSGRMDGPLQILNTKRYSTITKQISKKLNSPTPDLRAGILVTRLPLKRNLTPHCFLCELSTAVPLALERMHSH